MMTDYSIEFTEWRLDADLLTALRHEVFVNEQQVPIDMEIDEMDPQSQHIKTSLSNGKLIGTARLLPNHYIGRMCISHDFRHQGIGGAMLEFIIDYAQKVKIDALYLNAQITAQPFYQRYGFDADSDIFMEAGIPHVHMTLKFTY